MKHLIPSLGPIALLVALAATAAAAEVPDGDLKNADGHDECMIRIGVLSDMHITLTDNPRYAVYLEHFEKAIGEANQADLDLVLIPGDLTSSGKDEQYERFKELLERITAPVLYVAGNHDTGNKVSTKKKRLVNEERISQYQEMLTDSYFTAEPIPGLRVVGIDASLFGSGLETEDKQWAFLETELASSAGHRSTILMLHYPIYNDEPDEENGYSNVDREPRARLLDMLEKGTVDLVLSGHLHQPRDVTTASGLRMITAPALSFGLPFGEEPQAWATLRYHLCDGEVKSVQQHKVSEPTPPRKKRD